MTTKLFTQLTWIRSKLGKIVSVRKHESCISTPTFTECFDVSPTFTAGELFSFLTLTAGDDVGVEYAVGTTDEEADVDVDDDVTGGAGATVGGGKTFGGGGG